MSAKCPKVLDKTRTREEERREEKILIPPKSPTGESATTRSRAKKPSKTVTIDDITDWPNGGRDVWGPILAEWLQYKHDRRQDYKSLPAVHKLLVKFGTPAAFQHAVDHSMARNSAGCFLPSVHGHAKPKNESLF